MTSLCVARICRILSNRGRINNTIFFILFIFFLSHFQHLQVSFDRPDAFDTLRRHIQVTPIANLCIDSTDEYENQRNYYNRSQRVASTPPWSDNSILIEWKFGKKKHTHKILCERIMSSDFVNIEIIAASCCFAWHSGSVRAHAPMLRIIIITRGRFLQQAKLTYPFSEQWTDKRIRV